MHTYICMYVRMYAYIFCVEGHADAVGPPAPTTVRLTKRTRSLLRATGETCAAGLMRV